MVITQSVVPYENSIVEYNEGSTKAPHSFKPYALIEGKPRSEGSLAKHTPSTQKRWLELGGNKGFFYVKIGYVTERLIEAFGPEWFFDIERTWSANPDEKGQVEVIIEGRLYAPGLPVWGIRGIGGAKYMPQNAKAMYSTAIASAESVALKNAAKKLGIGIDVNEDPNEGAILEAKQQTIGTIAATLAQRGHGEAVAEILIRLAPQCYNSATGEIDHFLINEDQLDEVTKALLRVVNENPHKKE